MLNLLDRRIRVFSARPTISGWHASAAQRHARTRVNMRSRGSVRASTRRLRAIVRRETASQMPHVAATMLRRVFANARILSAMFGKPISSADGVNLLADRIHAFCRRDGRANDSCGLSAMEPRAARGTQTAALAEMRSVLCGA